MKADRSWTESESKIFKGVGFFEKQFKGGITDDKMSLLQFIQPYISQEDNDLIIALLDNVKIKKVNFELNVDSACGPDDFTGCFYQTCWNTVVLMLFRLYMLFFSGYYIA